MQGKVSIAFNSSTAQANLSSSVISNANNFMIRVNALQQNSKAKILSQAINYNLNNMQAILDKNDVTFYTKVSGEKVASLESITSGNITESDTTYNLMTTRIVLTGKRRERVRLLLIFRMAINRLTKVMLRMPAASYLKYKIQKMTTEADIKRWRKSAAWRIYPG